MRRNDDRPEEIYIFIDRGLEFQSNNVCTV